LNISLRIYVRLPSGEIYNNPDILYGFFVPVVMIDIYTILHYLDFVYDLQGFFSFFQEFQKILMGILAICFLDIDSNIPASISEFEASNSS